MDNIKHRALTHLLLKGPMTTDQLGVSLGLPPKDVSFNLLPLRTAGLVYSAGKGSEQYVTWVLTDYGKRELGELAHSQYAEALRQATVEAAARAAAAKREAALAAARKASRPYVVEVASALQTTYRPFDNQQDAMYYALDKAKDNVVVHVLTRSLLVTPRVQA